MFKLMDKKIITILHSKICLTGPVVFFLTMKPQLSLNVVKNIDMDFKLDEILVSHKGKNVNQM